MKTVVAGLMVAGVVLAGQAEALPLRGAIAFGGEAVPTSLDRAWDTTTTVDFSSPGSAGEAKVYESLGRFAGLTGLAAPHADFTFLPTLGPNPVAPLWSVGGYAFVLESAWVVRKRADFLLMKGTGTLTGPAGFAPMEAKWAFSAQRLDTTQSFSSSVAVPEPASLWLLGLGLLGGAALVRRTHGA
jgi:hypothetical protein